MNETASQDQRFRAWFEKHQKADILRRAEELPVRRDMITLLTFVRDNKITGTQSTGNLPLKAVREVTSRFVNPPQLEMDLGGEVYRVRSERDVWSLYFLHIVADIGDLVTWGPARRWRLTETGEHFLTAPALLQSVYMLECWWYGANWAVAFPYRGLADELPSHCSSRMLEMLRKLPVKTPVPFETFADELIEKTGLTWGSEDQTHATRILHAAVRQMIMDVLENFGVIRCEYRKNEVGGKSLTTFEITPFGETVLEPLAMLSE